MPNSAILRQRFLAGSDLWMRFQFIGSYDAIKLGLLTSLVLGLLFLLMVQCIPSAMTYLSVGLGALAFVGLAVMLILFDQT